MAHSHQVQYWLVVVVVFFLPLFTRRPVAQHFVGGELVRAARWLWTRADLDEEPDPFEADVYTMVRADRLRKDITRLQRILASDASMSAVRQLGNRLAYDQLLRELRASADLAYLAFPSTGTDWLSPAPAPVARAVAGSRSAAYAPQVETLELGRRR